MVWVSGGNTSIGSEKGAENEKPTFETSIPSFWIDVQPVTVGDFRKFVYFNRYVTTAEKQGFAMCYDSTTQSWQKVKGADWLYPHGAGKAAAQPNEPVRQVSWHDAQAYANWIGKRLPSELEWERALQNADKLHLAYARQDLWQWCDNWYFSYNETGYVNHKLNRPKSLRGSKGNLTDATYRSSIRHQAAPEECFFNFGFRCAY